MEQSVSHVDRTPAPPSGAFQISSIVEATIKNINVDESNNVTFTADVVTHKNETKHRVPFMFPYASADGSAGVFSVPIVGDKCLVALTPGNAAYIIGYHPAVQTSSGKASAALMSSLPTPASGTKSLKGTFAKSQLLPGAIEIKAREGNRVLLHPGGSIAIDAQVDLFTFYDAISSTIESLCRSHQLFTAGGFVLWEEGKEKTKKSMKFQAELFTKSATEENVNAGATRGGAKMTVLFSEEANHFLLVVEDENGIKSQIAIGPGGIILTSGNGTTSGSIAVSPDGNFALIAGNPNGLHTQIGLSESAIAMAALNGPTPLATVQASTDGQVQISGQTKVEIESQVQVAVVGTQVNLGSLAGLPVARLLDPVIVFGVSTGPSNANGQIMNGSPFVMAG